MIVIVVFACLITAASIWFMARPPALHMDAATHRLQFESVRDRLVAQLRELDADQVDRRVDDAVAGDEQRRLEFELAQVLKEIDGLVAVGIPTQDRQRRSPALVAILAVFLPALAGTLYVVQSRHWLRSILVPQPVHQAQQRQIPPFVYQMVAQLRRQLVHHPDDLNGWMRLARSYVVLGQRSQAQAAYRQAYRLAPQNIKVVSSYAWILYSAHPTRTKGEVATLYHQLYRLDPKHQDALWFLGLEAYNDDRLHRALGFWTSLLKLIPKTSPAAKGVREAIANIHQTLKHRQHPVRKPG